MSKVLLMHLTLCNKRHEVLLGLNLLKKCNKYIPITQYVTRSNSKHNQSDIDLDCNLGKILPAKLAVWKVTPSSDHGLMKSYMKLSKIRLTTLVVVTAMAGYTIAPAPFAWDTFGYCVLGTGLLSSAANAINQFHEVPFDAQMSRTKNRALVCGQLTPLHAMIFASSCGLSGLGLLYFGINGLTASLGLINLILYTSIYTPMKRISILNTWVGSIVGAIPPLMGWAACAGHLDPGAWLMAALLYSWQFPHFNALSWNLRPDYSRAGYRMMAVTDPALCRRVALRHTVAIAALSACAPFLDTTNWWFVLETAPLNGYFIYLAYQFYQNSSSSTSRKLFRFSLLHLPLLMVLFLVNKKKWFLFESEENVSLDLEVISKKNEYNSSLS